LEAIHRITHDLINQLAVINLCGFKIATQRRALAEERIERDAETLERAVRDATDLAEKLVIRVEESLHGRSSLRPVRTDDSAADLNNVVSLFASTHEPNPSS
jgi:hypothetical protein